MLSTAHSSYYTGDKRCDRLLIQLYSAQAIIERAMVYNCFSDEIWLTLANIHSKVIKFQDYILETKQIPKSRRLERILRIAQLWYPRY